MRRRPFGAPLEALGITRDDLQRPNTVIQLGMAPNRFDLLIDITGVRDFDTASTGREEHMVRGQLIPFLGRARWSKTSGRLAG